MDLEIPFLRSLGVGFLLVLKRAEEGAYVFGPLFVSVSILHFPFSIFSFSIFSFQKMTMTTR